MTYKNKALKNFNGDVSSEVLAFSVKAERFRLERQKMRKLKKRDGKK